MGSKTYNNLFLDTLLRYQLHFVVRKPAAAVSIVEQLKGNWQPKESSLPLNISNIHSLLERLCRGNRASLMPLAAHIKIPSNMHDMAHMVKLLPKGLSVLCKSAKKNVNLSFLSFHLSLILSIIFMTN